MIDEKQITKNSHRWQEHCGGGTISNCGAREPAPLIAE